MSARTRLTRALSAIRRLWSSTAERDLSDDVQAYVDMLTDEYMAAGMGQTRARQRALREVGGVEAIKTSVREARAGALLEQTAADARYAWRGLRRSPAYALTVVLTLGLGLGVNTTVFSILNTALLKPLPYERPEELVDLAHRLGEGPDAKVSYGVSWQELAFWRGEETIFQGAEARQDSTQKHWLEGGEPLLIGAMTAGFSDVLGVRPVVGRMFTRDEAMRGEPVAVISDGFWARAFDRATDAVGRTLTIDDRSITIIGIMPSTFRYGTASQTDDGRVHVFTPLAERGGTGGTSSILRLRSGVTLERANALAVEPARRFQADVPPREPWWPQLSRAMPARGLFTSRSQPMVWLLFVVSTMVLVIACANVANVLASRTLARGRELAVRAALGASRQRIARMLFCEGVVVTACGAVVAVLMAMWASAAIFAMTPSRIGWEMFAVSPPDLDWRVLSFVVAVTTMAAFLAALWPASRGARNGRLVALASGGGTTAGSPDRRRLAKSMHGLQVALVLILVVTSALFVRSFVGVLTADLGFDPERLLKVNVNMPTGRYASPSSRVQALNAIVDRIKDRPGVANAAVGNSPPIGSFGRMVRSSEAETQKPANASVRYAGPGYIETAGIELIAGRDFGPADTVNAPLVAIIDDAGARRAFPGESPLGQTISSGPGTPRRTIVGVVGSVAGIEFPQRYARIGLLYPQLQEVAQDDSPFGFTILVRSASDSSQVLADVRRTILAFEPSARLTAAEPVLDFYTYTEAFATPKYYAALISALGLIALLTAGVGVYGSLAFAVGQRTREIGVRLALGSTRWQIRRLVLREVLTPVVAGLALGALGLWLGGGLVESQLHGVTTFDPWALAASAVVLLLVAVAAVAAPIRRATGTDPLLALRTD